MLKPAIKSTLKPSATSRGKARRRPNAEREESKCQPVEKQKVTSAADRGNKSLKKALHPRNIHLNGYDFSALTSAFPQLKVFVRPTPYGGLSIDFADPLAVKTLNAALLKHHYGIRFWDIPKGALCPPIPGRVDYLHYLADLLAEGDKSSTLGNVRVLDIGTGANGIYPILGSQVYGWQFVASDINTHSLANVQTIIEQNPVLQGRLSLRLQVDERAVFKGIIGADDHFELTLCNPPFHASLAEASESSLRKVQNLAANQGGKAQLATAKLNFGGQAAELWCQGGERQFLVTMILESQHFAAQCLWFTSLVSKKENLKPCYQALAKLGVDTVKTIEMQQGNKITRVLAWSFHSQPKRLQWRRGILTLPK